MSDTPNRSPAVLAVTAATFTLATVFVFARIYCRACIVRVVSWDDWVMILAWVVGFFLSFTICLGAANGLGKYDDDVEPYMWPRLRICEYVFSVLYNPALMAFKTSILIFYLRLASNTQLILRYVSWATLLVVNLAGTVLTFMNIFQCSPIEAGWQYNYVGRPIKCIPLLTEFICAAPVNVLTDLAILAVPIPVLTSMRLPTRQKTILVITFALGIFITVVDVVRIFYLQRAITDAPTGTTVSIDSTFGGTYNFAWNASLALMWSAVEVNVGITIACVPTLKPLFLKFIPAVLHDPDGTGTSASKPDSRASAPRPDHNAPAHPRLAVPGHTQTHPSQRQRNGSITSERSRATASGAEGQTALEFLTAPDGYDVGASLTLEPSHAMTYMTTTSATENAVYFGFVNMAKPKSMLKTNAIESFKYCAIVSVIFFLWGFSYGLLNTLNNVAAALNGFSDAQTLGLTSAYFGGGYLFGPLLVGEWILRRDEHNRTKRHRENSAENIGGFKVTFIVGLCIYGTGTIIFWPSAVTSSYGGFMLSNFVVGFGLSVLEVGANAFLILCGPPQHSETRLLVAQGIQAVGTVLSGLLAQKVFFKRIDQEGYNASMSLINVQWTYLGITLLCVALALFFFYMPLPEVSDSELQSASDNLPINPERRSLFSLQLRTVSVVLAVFAQYCYVAAQECNSIYFRRLMNSIRPGANPTGEIAGGTPTQNSTTAETLTKKEPGLAISTSDYLLICHVAFALSRFLAAVVTFFAVYHRRLPRPRQILMLCLIMCFVTSLLLVVLHPSKADYLIIPVILFFFFEGPVFPLIFTMGLRGQGRRTKRAAAFITIGGSGPAFFPFIMYGIIENGGRVQTSYIVVIALQVAILVYPAWLQLSSSGGILVQPYKNAVPASAARSREPSQHRQAEDGSHDSNASPSLDQTSASRDHGASKTSEKVAGLVGKLRQAHRGRETDTPPPTADTPPRCEHDEVRQTKPG